MKLKDIFAPVSSDLHLVRQYIKNQIDGFLRVEQLSSEQYEHVVNVSEHFWAAPGKGLRPALVLLTAQLAGMNGQTLSPAKAVLQFAAVVELFHSASLIHDDVIDRAPSRRNQVSLNEQYGDHIAVVVGDELILEAFFLLFDLETSAAQQQEVIQIMRRTLRKMCLGELCEHHLLTTQNMANVAEYVTLLDQKTATLMSACCQCSAILTGSDPAIQQQMADFGTHFGIAFQVADDLKDQDALLKQGTDLVPIVQEYAEKARYDLSAFPAVPAKESLLALCDMLVPSGKAPGMFDLPSKG